MLANTDRLWQQKQQQRIVESIETIGVKRIILQLFFSSTFCYCVDSPLLYYIFIHVFDVRWHIICSVDVKWAAREDAEYVVEQSVLAKNAKTEWKSVMQ